MDPTAAFPMKALYTRKHPFCRLAVFLLLLLPVCGYATDSGTEQEVDASLREEVSYLLSFVGSDAAGNETFQVDRISALMRFVTGAKDPHVLYHAGTFNGAPSAYHEFDIHRSLSQILQLTYNPDIPTVVTMPASIRLSHWSRYRHAGALASKTLGNSAGPESTAIHHGRRTYRQFTRPALGGILRI